MRAVRFARLGRGGETAGVPTPRRRVVEPAAEVLAAFARARGQLGVPEGFPPEVAAAAWQAARRGPQDVPGAAPGRVDRTDLALVTIDPPGSRDLDQALHVARLGGGFVVHYAIADVAAFVEPGGPVDREAWVRGVTRYSPDLRTPLHPPVLSEDAASLLPGQDRAAVLWRLALSRDGTAQDVTVRRALVRSRAQLTYAEAQQAIDGGSDPLLLALSEVGRLRAEREWARGGISLQLPEQELTAAGIAYRVPLPVERWNAQISLLTGMAAAELALSRGEGVLRSLPAAPEEVVGGLRRQARALGLPWPAEASYADFVRTLQPARPTDAAMLHQAARGLRGAGYTALEPGTDDADVRHAALAAAYAHATAPLRRLADRYALEVALAVSADREVPDWVHEALPALPDAMRAATSAAAALDRSLTAIAEAAALRPYLGQTVAGVAVAASRGGRMVQLRHPAVITEVTGSKQPLGREVSLRVVTASLDPPTVALEPA